MKALLVSPDPGSRELMRVVVGGVERRLGDTVEYLEASDGESGARVARRELPAVVVADEISSRAGAFALAKDLRDSDEAFPGVIVILLERKHDAWLARWSGADAWFVKPVDPFAVADRVVELVSQRELV